MKYKNVTVDFSFTAVVALLLFIDKSGLMGVSLLAVIVHEFGHLSIMKACGAKINTVGFGLCGVKINANCASCGEFQQLLISLGGCGANLLCCLLFTLMYKASELTVFRTVITVNAVTMVFNLLPIRGLDGGDVLSFLLNRYFSEKRSDFILSIISCVFLFVILAAGIFILINNLNPTLLLLVLYLSTLTIMKSKQKE